jgi:predicted Zn-dependent peptidase
MSKLQHYSTRLDSGLRLIRVPMPAVQSVTALVLADVGSRNESPERWGVSHFLEHMVFKGTDKWPTAQELAVAVDAIGAKFNAFTSKEYTGYYVQAASQFLPLSLEVLSDMLLTPRLRTEDLEREKGVIVEEMNMYADMPASHIANKFDQMMFDSGTLGHDIIGTKETVTKFGEADFREHLEQWYSPTNLIVMIAGDAAVVESKDVIKMVETSFDKGDFYKRPARDSRTELGKLPFTDRRLHVEHKVTEQMHFLLAFPGLKRGDDRRFAQSILSMILGGTMSSRLFSEVREKRGLCYYVRTDVDTYQDCGTFGAAAGVDPKRVEEAIEVTLSEFYQVVNGKKPITAEELKRAKDSLVGRFALEFEDSESVASYYGMKELLQRKIETPDEVLKNLQAVTLKQVQSLAEELIKVDDLRFGIIGDLDEARVKKVLAKAAKSAK